jgi:hypothetical protein
VDRLGRYVVEGETPQTAARRSDGDGARLRQREGVKRAYKFKPSDSRVLEQQALERQLNAAAFLPTTKEDKDAYSLSDAERRTPTFRDAPGRQ